MERRANMSCLKVKNFREETDEVIETNVPSKGKVKLQQVKKESL